MLARLGDAVRVEHERVAARELDDEIAQARVRHHAEQRARLPHELGATVAAHDQRQRVAAVRDLDLGVLS